MPGLRARALQCVQFLRMPVGTGVPDCPFFLALSLPQSPFVRMFFGFALRNRRRSADEEKLRETQCVSYSSPPSGGAKFDCARDGRRLLTICASFAYTCADSRGRLSLQIGGERFAFVRVLRIPARTVEDACPYRLVRDDSRLRAGGRTKRKKEESRSSLLFFAVSLIT